jgi:iron-sulfur cluster repair protein YtfE (RIC family)
MPDDDLSLEKRTGLPEHLRVLADKYPRGEWTGHTNFDELTRFWLDRHLMFRDALARMQSDTEGFLDKQTDWRTYGSSLSRLGGFFINQLLTHHHIEDEHYFPALNEKDARLKAAFELLDSDHHALDAHLHALANDTNAVLQKLQQREKAEKEADTYRKTLRRFETFLNRHLCDEEEIVVPVILEHGSRGLH